MCVCASFVLSHCCDPSLPTTPDATRPHLYKHAANHATPSLGQIAVSTPARPPTFAPWFSVSRPCWMTRASSRSFLYAFSITCVCRGVCVCVGVLSMTQRDIARHDVTRHSTWTVPQQHSRGSADLHKHPSRCLFVSSLLLRGPRCWHAPVLSCLDCPLPPSAPPAPHPHSLTFSSMLFSVQKRNTCTSFFWPMRWARSIACQGVRG